MYYYNKGREDPKILEPSGDLVISYDVDPVSVHRLSRDDNVSITDPITFS